MEGITGCESAADLWQTHYSILFNDSTHSDTAAVAGNGGVPQQVPITVDAFGRLNAENKII